MLSVGVYCPASSLSYTSGRPRLFDLIARGMLSAVGAVLFWASRRSRRGRRRPSCCRTSTRSKTRDGWADCFGFMDVSFLI